MKKTDTKIATIIGKDSVVEGEFKVAGAARIDGTIEGNVKVTGNLVVGATGKINGDVEAVSAMVGGAVNGNLVIAEKTELTSTARIIGDIKTKVIVIDEKAVFQGRCDMHQEDAKIKKRPIKERRAVKKSAKDALREALKEAEAYDGPSIIIAYSPCIAHNIKGGLYNAQLEAKLATECGYFPLFRYNPDLALEGKNPFQLDSKEPNWDRYNEFLMQEGRYAQLKALNPAEAEALLEANLKDAQRRYRYYQRMLAMDYSNENVK